MTNRTVRIYERNVGAKDGLRDKEAYRDQSITKSRVHARPYTGVNHPTGGASGTISPPKSETISEILSRTAVTR